MPMLNLNPTGLLTKLFGQDVRRPVPPQWIPTGEVPPGVGGIGQDGPQSAFTWDWYRVQLELSQERLDLYRDYEDMDQDDLIASVLDAVAEDGSQTDFMTGRRIWVESDNPQIEKMGLELLEKLDAESTCPQIIRETAKFGDNFEFVHHQRGIGVIAHEYVQPQMVWRYERAGRLSGFTMGEQPQPNPEQLQLPWQFIHFMRPGGRRYPGVQYGDAWIRPARRLYRKFRMVEDAMIMYRIRLVPDRDVYYIDVGEAPPDQQVSLVKMWKRLFKKNISYNLDTGILRGEVNPLAYDEDIFWPTKDGNDSRVERLRGSTNVGEIFDVEFLVNRMFSALRAPKEYFGFGEGGAFDRGKSLEQQDIRWARGVKNVQEAVTRGYVRLIQIHMALKGIDPLSSMNQFSVKMCPVSALDEIQRADLYDIRLRSMEGLTRLVSDLQGLDKKKWFKWLLEKFGGFREGFFDQFITQSGEDAQNGVPGAGTFGLEGHDLTSSEKRFLMESLPQDIGYRIHSAISNGTRSTMVTDRLPVLGAAI